MVASLSVLGKSQPGFLWCSSRFSLSRKPDGVSLFGLVGCTGQGRERGRAKALKAFLAASFWNIIRRASLPHTEGLLYFYFSELSFRRWDSACSLPTSLRPVGSDASAGYSHESVLCSHLPELSRVDFWLWRPHPESLWGPLSRERPGIPQLLPDFLPHATIMVLVNEAFPLGQLAHKAALSSSPGSRPLLSIKPRWGNAALEIRGSPWRTQCGYCSEVRMVPDGRPERSIYS